MTPPANLVLAPDEIHVWRAALDQPAAQVAQFARLLASDEQLRANRFHFERDQQRFIVGRGILRTILGRYLGCDGSEFQFSYGARGKPALTNPIAEPPLYFNPAHSGGLMVIVLASNQELGVDVEQIRPIADMEQIVQRFFAPSEQAALLGLPVEQRQEAFFNGWTRKEAYLKALGDGLARPLDQFCVSLVPGEPARLLSIREDEADASHWFLRSFHPAPGYVAAVAVRGHAWRFNYWDWT
ncbi:MAG: 4'-phosphopantetheinyl transferase superfamily protein [Anaerolineae bacterium]